MARLSRGKRRLATFIVGFPMAAAILFASGASPASAATYFSMCPSSGYTCFFGGTDWSPKGSFNDVVGLQGTNRDWRQIGDSSNNGEACGGTNWNDCAGSDRNLMGRDMWVWKDVFCEQGVLDLPAGVSFDLANHTFDNGVNANNAISSDRVSSGSGC